MSVTFEFRVLNSVPTSCLPLALSWPRVLLVLAAPVPTVPALAAIQNCQYRGCGEHKLEKSAASATICGVRIQNSQKYSETLEQLIVHLT